MSDHPGWPEGFERTVLAAAVGGPLLARVGSLFRGPLFGPPAAPRARIAAVIEVYWTSHQVAPTAGELEVSLQTVATRLSETERAALREEWAMVQGTPVPTGTGFLEERLQEWVARKSIERTLLDAADRVQGGDLEELRQFIAEGIEPPAAANERHEQNLVGDAPERLSLWHSGEEYGEPIPTGLPAFDQALGGGPRRSEAHYVLAPPKGAKSTLLTNIAIGAVRRRFNVYMVTFEMHAHRMLLRADRTLTRSSRYELRNEPERLVRALRGLTAAGGGELWVWEAPPQLPRACEVVKRRIERLQQRTGITIDVVVLDYLNIMGSAKNEREKRHELARISREIAALGRELDVVVWSAALVKREAVAKEFVRKQDISECFEVVAVADGMTAVCATKEMRQAGLGTLYIAAMREHEDEVSAGTYRIDRERGVFLPFYEQPEGFHAAGG